MIKIKKLERQGQVGNQTLFWVVFGVLAVGLVLLLSGSVYSPRVQPQAQQGVAYDATGTCGEVCYGDGSSRPGKVCPSECRFASSGFDDGFLGDCDFGPTPVPEAPAPYVPYITTPIPEAPAPYPPVYYTPPPSYP